LISKFLITAVLLTGVANATEDNAKFLVVDSKTHEKIKILNILNGGIEKEYIISSLKLAKKDLEKYYPEYFLYDGLKCNTINSIQTNKNNLNKKVTVLSEDKDIKNEIKKIKLLQMLNDEISTNIDTSTVNPSIVKAIGVLCSSRLFLRGQSYGKGDVVGNMIIKSINTKNSSILVENK